MQDALFCSAEGHDRHHRWGALVGVTLLWHLPPTAPCPRGDSTGSRCGSVSALSPRRVWKQRRPRCPLLDDLAGSPGGRPARLPANDGAQPKALRSPGPSPTAPRPQRRWHPCGPAWALPALPLQAGNPSDGLADRGQLRHLHLCCQLHGCRLLPSQRQTWRCDCASCAVERRPVLR